VPRKSAPGGGPCSRKNKKTNLVGKNPQKRPHLFSFVFTPYATTQTRVFFFVVVFKKKILGTIHISIGRAKTNTKYSGGPFLRGVVGGLAILFFFCWGVCPPPTTNHFKKKFLFPVRFPPPGGGGNGWGVFNVCFLPRLFIL